MNVLRKHYPFLAAVYRYESAADIKGNMFAMGIKEFWVLMYDKCNLEQAADHDDIKVCGE